MSERLLPLSPELNGDTLVAYLNKHIDDVKHACDLDVSWAYIRAVIDDVRVISATRELGEIRIEYRYDYTAHCACKNLDASDFYTDQLSCKILEGNIVLPKFVPQERSTFEEF